MSETKLSVFRDLLDCYRVQREASAPHPNDPAFQRELDEVVRLQLDRFMEAAGNEGGALIQAASAICDEWELSMGANLLSVPAMDALMKRLHSVL